MTTKEYLTKLECDVKKMEIREKLEDDPHKRKTLQRKKDTMLKTLKQFRNLFSGGIECAAMDADGLRKHYKGE